MKHAVMAAAALAVAAAAPASAKEAFFAVRISATQDVTWTRDMTVQGCSDSHASTPPRDPGACPQAVPAASDCGTQALPGDATLSLSYVPSKLTLTGPHSMQWFAAPFQHCPGVNGDDSLGATWYTSGVVQTGPVPLPMAKVFGKRKQFTLHWSDKRTVETVRPGGIVLSGTYPVTTTIRWSIRFTRLAKPPQPELGVPEGL
jgi:hypothetical protein